MIGADTRQLVEDTTQYPTRTIGHLTFNAGSCTGTLIGPRHVLTAAHCLYDTDEDQWYSGFEFTPGRAGATRPFRTVSWESAFAPTGWTREHRREFDIGLIVLDRDIGEQVGWMGFAAVELPRRFNVSINGYPGDKPAGTMWSAVCPVEFQQPQRFYYGCDTFGGMSGSAVHEVDDQGPVAYGVHVNGIDSTGLNSATRINRAFFELLDELIRTT